MKILFGCCRYPPAIGGVEQHVGQMAERLASRGHDVRVIASDLIQVGGERVVPAEATPGAVRSVARLRSYSAPLPGLRNYPLLPSLVPLLASSTADVWHAHAFWYWPGDAMLMAARMRRVPLVASPYFFPRRHPIWGTYLRSCGRFLERADVVTVLSLFEHDLLKQYGIAPRRVELITPGVDLAEFDRAAGQHVYERFSLHDRQVVLFVGRLGVEKGADVLIAAAPEILRLSPDAAIVLVGPDFGERRALETEVRRRGLHGSVVFAGELSRSDHLSAYRAASVFVLPTRYEAFGIVFIEAMASGLPVVAPRVTAVPEVVLDGETGVLCQPGDAQNLAESVALLLRDDVLRKQMGQRGRNRVEREFTLDVQVRRMESIYRSIA